MKKGTHKVDSLHSRMFEYAKRVLTKAHELNRKDVVEHFEKEYCSNNNKFVPYSTIRTASDTILRYLSRSKFICRHGKGHYILIKEIPSEFTWSKLYDENRK